MTDGRQDKAQVQRIVAFVLERLQPDTGLVPERVSEASLRGWARGWVRSRGDGALRELEAAWQSPGGTEGEALRRRVIDSVLITETYFYRFGGQLKALSSGWLRRRVEQRRPVTIWSAGCSTGQEAYTLVGLALQAGAERSRVSALGTDLCGPCLETAAAGEYAAQTAEGLPERLRDMMLEPSADGHVRVRQGLRQLVTWRRGDLVGEGPGGRFALVACRNVLLYYEPQRREAMVERLVSALEPRGVLLLGHGDELPGGPGAWGLARADGPGVYRLAGEGGVTVKHPGVQRREPLRFDQAVTGVHDEASDHREPTEDLPRRASQPLVTDIYLQGQYDGDEREGAYQTLATSLADLVDAAREVRVFADGAETLDAATGRLLARASRVLSGGAGRLLVVTSRAPVERWARKHGLTVVGKELHDGYR